MKIFKINILRDNKGQSVVEFALVLPVLVLLLTGILEFGILLNDYLSVTHASRDAARYASLGEIDSVITTKIYNLLPRIDNDEITINISPNYSSRDRGDAVTVAITYNYQVTLPAISSVIGNSIPIKAETTMRVE